MNVFKFGGASVKDAQGVKNVATVLEQTGHTNLVIVVSAMGKMTNALEGVVTCYFKEPAKVKQAIEDINARITLTDKMKSTTISKASRRQQFLLMGMKHG